MSPTVTIGEEVIPLRHKPLLGQFDPTSVKRLLLIASLQGDQFRKEAEAGKDGCARRMASAYAVIDDALVALREDCLKALRATAVDPARDFDTVLGGTGPEAVGRIVEAVTGLLTACDAEDSRLPG